MPLKKERMGMENYSSLANKYFRENKGRSLLNVVAIILAVMFISGTGHMVYSFQQNLISTIRANGDYHVTFNSFPEEKLEILKKHSAVDKASYCETKEYGVVGKSFIAINEIDKDGLDIFGVSLKEGRLPSSFDEIIVSTEIKESENKKIGDKITVNIGREEQKNYTIVGFSHPTNRSIPGSINAYKINKNISFEKPTVYVKLKEVGRLNSKINDLAEEFKVDPNNVSKNEGLLMALGEGRNSVAIFDYVIFLIITLIVILSIVVFIYNSFNIATMERMKEYGLIKAIGGTNKQIKKIIIKEGFIIGIIALPIGLILGIAAGIKTFDAFNGLLFDKVIKVKTYISIYSILATILITFITIYLASISSIRKAKKLSPLDCFSNRSFQVKVKKAKKSLLVNKLFKVEGLIANRNIRINKGRFRTTTFSIIFSILLFITFSSLVYNMEQLMYATSPYGKMFSKYKHTFYVDYNKELGKEDIEKICEKISTLAEKTRKDITIKEVYETYEGIKAYTFMPKEKVVVKGDSVDMGGKKYTNVVSEIIPFNLNSVEQLSPYLIDGTVDRERVSKEKGVYITEIGFKKENGEFKKKDIATLKVGDEILIDTSNLMYTNKFESKDNTLNGAIKVKVLGVVKGSLFEKEKLEDMLPAIYMPLELYRQIIEKKYAAVPKGDEENQLKRKEITNLEAVRARGIIVSYKDNVTDKDRTKNSFKIGGEMSKIYSEYSLNGGGLFDDSTDRLIKLIKLFSISIISFITIISLANVFNIVYTNIILRKRELALLGVVGASPKSIKKIIYLEGMLFSIIGIVFGGIIGGINSIVITRLFNCGYDSMYKYQWKGPLLSIVFFIMVGILAVIFPLRRLKKENPIQSLRGE